MQTLPSTLQARWRDLLDGFWFVPGLIALVGPVLAFLCLQIDHRVGSTHLPFLFTGNATAASTLLSAIAGAVMAVLGLVFSITIVTLQLVTSQFTPRALRGFLADRMTQGVAGSFLGLFAYALFVLTAVHDPAQTGPGFIPTISITVAIGFSLLGLVLLLLFFHHTAESIQVFNITAKLAKETLHAIDHLYPTWGNGSQMENGSALVERWDASGSPQYIRAPRSGYVQSIAFHHLLHSVASLGPDLRVHLVVCPGDFVTKESVVMAVWVSHKLEETEVTALRRSVILSDQRDMVQDAGFGMRQLTDIALRAMSPAVNDPTTAVNCIQYLQAIFEHLVRFPLPSEVYHIHDGIDHVVVRSRTFEDYLQVFVEIGRVTTDNARVADALLSALEAVAALVTEQEQERLPTLAMIAQAIAEPAMQDARTELDRTQLLKHLARLEERTHTRTEAL